MGKGLFGRMSGKNHLRPYGEENRHVDGWDGINPERLDALRRQGGGARGEGTPVVTPDDGRPSYEDIFGAETDVGFLTPSQKGREADPSALSTLSTPAKANHGPSYEFAPGSGFEWAHEEDGIMVAGDGRIFAAGRAGRYPEIQDYLTLAYHIARRSGAVGKWGDARALLAEPGRAGFEEDIATRIGLSLDHEQLTTIADLGLSAQLVLRLLAKAQENCQGTAVASATLANMAVNIIKLDRPALQDELERLSYAHAADGKWAKHIVKGASSNRGTRALTEAIHDELGALELGRLLSLRREGAGWEAHIDDPKIFASIGIALLGNLHAAALHLEAAGLLQKLRAEDLAPQHEGGRTASYGTLYRQHGGFADTLTRVSTLEAEGGQAALIQARMDQERALLMQRQKAIVYDIAELGRQKTPPKTTNQMAEEGRR